MKRSNVTITAVLLALLSCCLVGCSKKDKAADGEDKIELEINDAEAPKKFHRWSETDSVICVVFGYGYNDNSFYTDLCETLADKYGLENEKGMIWPLLFPDDFNGGSGRISELYNLVGEKKVRGMLLLGAPENTHYTLARLQDNNEGKIPYPVFSFFPQDDILGMESTCDFVLDYERSAKEDSNAEETTQQIDKSIKQIVLNAIKYMADQKGPLPADGKLHEHVQQIVGKNKKVRRFVDSETGLQSQNHFVIERDEVKIVTPATDLNNVTPDTTTTTEQTTTTTTDKKGTKKK